MSNIKKILNVRRYKAGYEVRTELIDGSLYDTPDIEMKSAYTIPDGYYIGNSECAYRLCRIRGIKPEPLPEINDEDRNSNAGRGLTCCIGFCEKEQKWYGWSHRAIYGFGIGDKVNSEDHCCAKSGWIDEYLQEHPEEDYSLPVGFEAKTIEDVKRMAIAFAESVG